MKNAIFAALALCTSLMANPSSERIGEMKQDLWDMSSLEAENLLSFDSCVLYAASVEEIRGCLKEKADEEKRLLDRFMEMKVKRMEGDGDHGRTLKGHRPNADVSYPDKYRRNPNCEINRPRPDAIKKRNFLEFKEEKAPSDAKN